MMVGTNIAETAWAVAHAALRQALLDHIVTALEADERFVAAWLIGSVGRGEQDEFSDLDLVAVVATEHADALCARPWRSAGRTTPERLALIRQFGTPVVIHEYHGNADSLGMRGGTLTLVIYETGVELDLFLARQDAVERPYQSRLLFDLAGLPIAPPPEVETLEKRQENAVASVEFFWAMAVIACKYWRRGWDLKVHTVMEQLHSQLRDARRAVEGGERRYTRITTEVQLVVPRTAQAAALRALCDEMERLMPAVEAMGVDLLPAPRAQIERWLGAR